MLRPHEQTVLGLSSMSVQNADILFRRNRNVPNDEPVSSLDDEYSLTIMADQTPVIKCRCKNPECLSTVVNGKHNNGNYICLGCNEPSIPTAQVAIKLTNSSSAEVHFGTADETPIAGIYLHGTAIEAPVDTLQAIDMYALSPPSAPSTDPAVMERYVSKRASIYADLVNENPTKTVRALMRSNGQVYYLEDITDIEDAMVVDLRQNFNNARVNNAGANNGAAIGAGQAAGRNGFNDGD